MRQFRYLFASVAVTWMLLVSCQDQVMNERSPEGIVGNIDSTESGDGSALLITDQACQSFRDCKDGALCMSASVNNVDGMYCGFAYREDAKAKAGLELYSACNCIRSPCTMCQRGAVTPLPPPKAGPSGNCACIRAPCNCPVK